MAFNLSKFWIDSSQIEISTNCRLKAICYCSNLQTTPWCLRHRWVVTPQCLRHAESF